MNADLLNACLNARDRGGVISHEVATGLVHQYCDTKHWLVCQFLSTGTVPPASPSDLVEALFPDGPPRQGTDEQIAADALSVYFEHVGPGVCR